MTTSDFSLLVVGSINVDIYLFIENFPKQGETVSTIDSSLPEIFAGGKGANQAAAGAKLGASTTLVGQFGDDSYGTFLREKLEHCNVNLSLTNVNANCPSGQAYILAEKSGQNTIIITAGANGKWPETLSDEIISSITQASVVLLQREIPDRINLLIAKEASRLRIPVVMDVGGRDEPFDKHLYPYLTFLCPNETELGRLTNMSITTKDQAIESAKWLIQEHKIENVLVTLGVEGSVVVTKSLDVFLESSVFVSADEIQDTTGAGDWFRAAFAIEYVQSRSIEAGLRFAKEISANVIKTKGAF